MVPHLGQRLGQLHRQAVQFEIVPEGVACVHLRGLLRDPRAHGDKLQRQRVGAQLRGLRGVPEEVGQAQPAVAGLPGELETRHLALRVGCVPDDQGLALGMAREVTMYDGELTKPVGLHTVEQTPQPRASLGLHEFVVGRAAAHPAQSPPACEQRLVVQPGHNLGQLDALGHAGAPERRGRHVDSARHIGAVDSAQLGQLTGLRGDPARTHLGKFSVGLTSFDRHDCVHQLETLERVLRVTHRALVERGQVVVDERPGQRGSAEQHRESARQTAIVQLEQVVLHHQRRLHQQTAHADCVGVMLLSRLDDRRDRLLDAQVDYRVSVVGHDDVDQILPDVVYIALYGRQHQSALAGPGQ